MKKQILNSMIWLLLFAAATVMAGVSEVDGVFGLAPMPEDAALAVWVPLDSDESISGVSWYNNDGTKAFPELLAVAGSAGEPSVLNNAVVVGEDVSGVTLGWSEVVFETPLASSTAGLFLVFRLPLDGQFVAEGQGAGLGYQLGDGQVRCWMSAGEGEWDMLSPEYQMAVIPVMNTNKSGDVLVLGGGDQLSLETSDDKADTAPLVSGLTTVPNPFNPQTDIRFSLPTGGDVKLTIFDVRGREVRSLVSGAMAAGAHSVMWNGRDDRGQTQPSGVYLALMESGSIRLTKRLTLVQ